MARRRNLGRKRLSPSAIPTTPLRVALIDLENCFGTGDLVGLDHDDLRFGGAELLEDIGYGDGYHVHVGVAHRNALPAMTALPKAKIHQGSGENGAESALAEAAMREVLALGPKRVREVVVASGDNLLADTVRAFESIHIPVTVVAHPFGLGREIAAAASRVLELRLGFGRWTARS
jgi:hypothetical protein